MPLVVCVMPSAEGEWTVGQSGGCPPSETWAENPQFAIYPTVDGATYEIEVVRHPSQAQVRE